ncbi:MAG: hypothetical protein ABIO71_07320 [Caldimonas sp.]
MNLIDRARRFLALTTGRGLAAEDDDPADMGTAFGLDAITILEPESADDIAARSQAAVPSRFELRLHRRSTF